MRRRPLGARDRTVVVGEGPVPIALAAALEAAVVVPSLEELTTALASGDATQVVLPVTTGLDLRAVLAVTSTAGVRLRIADREGDHWSLRDLALDDLYRRRLDASGAERVAELVAARTVLVTGAGGSIGSEICRQVAALAPERLVMLDHAENPLFEIELEMRRRWPALPMECVVADVRHEDRVHRVFERYRPHAVLHAAAHKHVPMMEANVVEAITNNVGGTLVLLEAAVRAGTPHFVLVSTDKAVRPTSVMGATKRVAELLVRAVASRAERHFVSVRFGNVLDSRGSVVPIFREQVLRGGPVTVTHPEMQRYFMSIPQAVQLVLLAGALGKGDELFLLDMGAPVRIVDLARDVIRVAGLREGDDIEIRFTGVRPGERLFEELVLGDELVDRTAHPDVLRIRSAEATAAVDDEVRRLLDEAREHPDDDERLVGRLMALVPDYRPEGRRVSESITPPR